MARIGWILGLVFLGACARNPVTGRPEVVLMSAEGERAIGREEALKVEEAMGVSDDADLQDYVARIGARLAKHSPYQEVVYTFRVVDTPEPNAFALPGGPVYLSRGLLAFANSEDEVACVIGHEIGHVAARHTVRRLTRAAPFAIVGIPGAILGVVSETLGNVVSAPARIAGSVALAPYSRAQEREADRIGMQIAAKAGWDPDALALVLRTLEREDTARRGEERKADFFDSHPTTPDRIANIDGFADALEYAPAAPIARDRDAFLGILEGLLVGPNPKGGVFDGGTFLHPEMAFVLDFPEGWKTDNQPTVVVAMDPDSDRKVFSVLQIAGEGDDPAPVAREELTGRLADELVSEPINGLPAVRLRTERMGIAYDLSWIAHGGQVYRISGLSPSARADALHGTFDDVARSFRPLRDADRSRIREGRLRLATAQPGESLAGLVERSDSTWDVEIAAIANALSDGDVALRSGEKVKVSVPQRYEHDSER